MTDRFSAGSAIRFTASLQFRPDRPLHDLAPIQHSAGPDYLFNQVQTARALSIRAEIDGTTEEKRRWLERAASYLEPAAAAGKLTRYEREVLLAGIRKQMVALGSPQAPP